MRIAHKVIKFVSHLHLDWLIISIELAFLLLFM